MRAFLRSIPWRILCRLFCLMCFVAFLFAGQLPVWIQNLAGRGTAADGTFSVPLEFLTSRLNGFLPELSAFSLISIGLTGLLVSGIGALFALLFFLGAFTRGRIFCSYVCPIGTCAEFQAKYLPSAKIKVPFKLNGVLFWTTLVSALLGVPLFLFLDPLCTFNRLGVFLDPPFQPAALIPAGLLLLIFLAGFLKPMFWCANCCPLGYLFTTTGQVFTWLRKRNAGGSRPENSSASGGGVAESASDKARSPISMQRREVLTGLVLGLPAAFLLKRISVFRDPGNLPVLPPGAGNLSDFYSRCSRCYACVNTCPARIIRVEMPAAGESVSAAFAPRLITNSAACSDSCNLCTQVCPTRALKPHPLEEKNRIQLGIAQVDHTKCLAWGHGEHCLVCDEYCPYSAFEIHEDENGIPCPVVLADKCRGCGFCQSACPVRSPGPAIRVHGVPRQRILPAETSSGYGGAAGN